MSTSTDGQICFGVLLDEGVEMPWEAEDLDENDMDAWWRKETGYVALPGHTYEDRRDWLKAHPLPFDRVNVCSGDCPIYILALPSPSLSASRGYPLEFNPRDLEVGDYALADLRKFMEKYFPDVPFEPKWYLSSYWG